MKLSLIVLTPGKMEGKAIAINIPQFLIGRDPQCHLRPASPLISKKHCAVLIRGDKAFVRDFESTNGTAVNEQPIKGEQELNNNDSLRVGPLDFRVVLEITQPVVKAVMGPKPVSTSGHSDDDAAAAMLLSIQDDGSQGSSTVDSDGIPTGSTVMEVLPQSTVDAPKDEAKASGGAEREKAAKAAQGNTSTAAKAILEKYMRRPRG